AASLSSRLTALGKRAFLVFFAGSLQIEDEPPLPPLPSPVAFLRGIVRAALLLAVVGIALLDYWLNVRKDVHTKQKSQGDWLHRSGLRVARLLSIQVETCGKLPREGLVVSNHLSYLDIIMLAAVGSFALVSHAAVADWASF